MTYVRNTAMNEELIQFSWMFRLYSAQNLKTNTDQVIEIIDPGQLNHDAGPDFFNSKVKIDGTLWAGNVEIHTYSNEWYHHNHHKDPAYNNVVLHVVFSANDITRNELGKAIPILELPVYGYVFKNFNELKQIKSSLACENKLESLSPFLFSDWLCNLHAERLIKKYEHIRNINLANRNYWNATFYQLLFRSFGTGINSDPFEQLFCSITTNILEKHFHNIFQLEALLFGQAGFLNELLAEDEYYMSLSEEYRFLVKKYALKPMPKHVWKFLRLRPGNFPTVRIAQLAGLLHHRTNLVSRTLEAPSLEYLFSLFSVKASEYWKTHYRFNVSSTRGNKKPGKSTITSIIINCIVPFIYAYGRETGNHKLQDQAENWLENLPAESNSIVRKWQSLGFNISNALESQAIIQLHKAYCSTKNCIRCRIGHQIIAKPSE